MRDLAIKEINGHIDVANSLLSLTDLITKSSQICIDCLRNGGKIILFGNGGSAADAQHIAAELIGRFNEERSGLSAIALTTDTSVLTSIGNDFGYERIFERQIEALANQKDVVIAISTSGKSVNVINALKVASKIGCISIGLSSMNGGEMNNLCEINIAIPAKETARIQEMHIVIGHIICHIIDQEFKV